MAVRGGLTNSCERREVKNKGKKGKIYPFEGKVLKNSNKTKESLPQQPMQRNRGKEQNGKD